jgi:hypothetical protein
MDIIKVSADLVNSIGVSNGNDRISDMLR